jgi:16S rRNA processing protein RimM
MRWRLSSRQSVESQSVESKTSNLDGNLKIGNRRSAIEDQQMAAADASGEWITLAVVIKTQGRHGEVATELHTDVPGRFQQDMRLWALTKDGQRREVTVEDLWPHKNFLVLKFQGVETINDAEPLIGAELQLPRRERAQLERGWTYLSDLIGCTVFDGQREIGQIEDVQFGAGEAPLLVVRGNEQKSKLPYEIPFAEAFLEKLDLERRQVRMKLPEGLLEVNAPLAKEEGSR